MLKNKHTLRDLLALLSAAAGLSFLLAWLGASGGSWWSGWGAYALLLVSGLGLLLWLRQGLRVPGTGWAAALTAATLCLLLGVGLMLALPVFGYDNPRHNAGYVFADAFQRDTQAWQLASDPPQSNILSAFTGAFSGDQYGGMLALSAWVYRTFSGDAHRPFLVLLLTAAASAAGVLLTWAACRNLWGETIAARAAWIYALYPEAVLLGASQMRESFVFSAVALAFYAMTLPGRSRLAWGAAAAALLLAFQPPAALVVLVLTAGWWLLDANRKSAASANLWPIALGLAGFLVVLFLVVSVWARLPSLQNVPFFQILYQWLQNNFNLQTTWTIQKSGWLQIVFDDIGKNWRLPLIMIYGLAQPALPGALADDGAWIMRLIAIYRSLGWYLLVPFLLYALPTAWRQKTAERRRQLIWAVCFVWLWILIAVANAGGDQWDNPRYRAILLAWQAALAAWVWVSVGREAWFKRLLAIEAVYVVIFTLLYLLRGQIIPFSFNLWTAAGLVLICSAGIVIGGWWSDRRRKERS